MYEQVTVVGERGQITIPKAIREIEGLKPGNKVIVKIEDNKIIVEKPLSKKEKDKLMQEYFTKYRKLEEEVAEEWKYASKEADAMIDDY